MCLEGPWLRDATKICKREESGAEVKACHRETVPPTRQKRFFKKCVMIYLSLCNRAWVASEMFTCINFPLYWKHDWQFHSQKNSLTFLFQWVGGKRNTFNIKTLNLHFLALQFIKHLHAYSFLLSVHLHQLCFIDAEAETLSRVTLLLVAQWMSTLPLKSSLGLSLPQQLPLTDARRLSPSGLLEQNAADRRAYKWHKFISHISGGWEPEMKPDKCSLPGLQSSSWDLTWWKGLGISVGPHRVLNPLSN